MVEIVQPGRGPKRIQQARFKQAEGVRNVYYITAEVGTEWSDVMNPDYWAHIARTLRPADLVEVMDEGGTFYGRVLVIEVKQVAVVVQQLDLYDLTKLPKGAVSADDVYSIDWKGPHLKFVIMRGNIRAAEGFASREDAQRHLANSIMSKVA